VYSILILSIYPNIAFAYIDPGSVSLLLQGLLASFAAIAINYKTLTGYIKNKIFGAKETTDHKSKEGEQENEN
jgi:hypothetical protein